MKREFVYSATRMKSRRRDLRQKQTEAEVILWNKIRNNQLGVKFKRQYSVNNYVIDFYCVEKKLGIEVEGGIHDTKESKIYDTYRERYLEAFGIKIIKIRNEEIEKNIDEVTVKISFHLTPDPSL